MYCKKCGNPHVKVGKYCSCCGTHMDPLPVGWIPLVPKASNEEKKRNKQMASKQSPEIIQKRKDTARVVGVVILSILKVVGIVAFAVVYILLGTIIGLASDKGKGKRCTPHYGYRYGRWYYGNGHRYGCQGLKNTEKSSGDRRCGR